MTARGSLQPCDTPPPPLLFQARHVFALYTNVTKLSGIGEDSLFMGLIETTVPPPDTARAWVMCSTGSVIAVDPAFSDWLGYTPEDVKGMNGGFEIGMYKL